MRRETWSLPAQPAGQNVVYRVPGGIAGAVFLCAHGTLTTDATVANRTGFFRISDPNGNTLFAAGSQVFQTAGQTVEYTLSNLSFFASSADGLFDMMAGGQMAFNGDEIFTIGVGNIQVGDVWSDLTMTVMVP